MKERVKQHSINQSINEQTGSLMRQNGFLTREHLPMTKYMYLDQGQPHRTEKSDMVQYVLKVYENLFQKSTNGYELRLVVLGFNVTLTAKVKSWRSVTHMCFLACSYQY